MSESYKLPSRKNRTRSQHPPEDPQHRQDMLSHDRPGRWAHDKHAVDDPEDDLGGAAAHPDLRQPPGRVEQALLDAGLDSSDEDEEEGEQAEEEEGRQQQDRKKKMTGVSWQGDKQVDGGGRDGALKQQGQGQGGSGDNPFGALVRAPAPKPGAGKPNRLVSVIVTPQLLLCSRKDAARPALL